VSKSAQFIYGLQGTEQNHTDFSRSGGSSFVAVVQPTDMRHRHDRPDSGRLNRAWHGRVLLQGEVCSGLVVVV